jgi:NAD(P)-dependent dehydrogenase (short-subunit alcohol dehydrogenase family)
MLILPSSVDLSGKTVLVTGAAGGLGFAAARQILVLGPKLLIIAVKDIERGELAQKKLLSDPEVKAAHPKTVVKVMQLDLGSYINVLSFAKSLKMETDLLHMALLDAAPVPGVFERTADGHEAGFQNVFLSNALLALELLPLLDATSMKTNQPSTLTWVSSQSQRCHTFTQNPIKPGETLIMHMDDPANYSTFRRHPDAKLLAGIYIKDLSRRVSSSSVTINAVCPGVVTKQLGPTAPMYLKGLDFLCKGIFGNTPEQGAKTYLHALFSGEESHGKFIVTNYSHPLNEDAPLADITKTEAGENLRVMLWEETKKDFLSVDSSLENVYELLGKTEFA